AARAAKDAVATTSGAVRGTVKLGTLMSINNIDLPTLLAELHARHPGVLVQFRFARAGSAGLAQQLRDGTLAVALVVFPDRPPADLHTRLAAPLPPRLGGPADPPLSHQGR